MSTTLPPLPKGYEDAKPIEISAHPILPAFPKGYEDAKPIEKFQSPIPTDNTIGRHLVEALPYMGSVAGSAIAPGLGTTAGIGLGTMVKQALQKQFPDKLGEAPSGVGEIGMDLGKEILLNQTLPWGLSKLGGLLTQVGMQGPKAAAALKLSNFPAVREGAVSRMTQQINRNLFPETGVIEQGAENAANRFGELKDTVEATRAAHPDLPPSKSLEIINGKPQIVEIPGGPHPETLAAMEHLSNVYGKNRVGGMLIRMQKEAQNFGGDIARTQTYKEIANTTLSDVAHVQNAKLTGGEEFTRDLAANRILTGAGNQTEGTIDAAKALADMTGKNNEIYKEAMGNRYDTMKTLLEKMNDLQRTNTTDTLLRYSGHKLMWSTAGAIIHGPMGAAEGLAVSSALPLTDRILRRIMSDEATAKLVTAALQTPASAPQAGLINKALQVALPRLFQVGADIAATPER